MLASTVLAIFAFGVIVATTATAQTTKNRDRRSTFLDIVNDRSSSESSYKFPILPVELPIKLGGHGGVNLPVLVLPVPVPVYMNSDSCSVNQNKPEPVEKAVSPQFILPQYVASRSQFPSRQPATVQLNSQRQHAHTEQTLDDSLTDNDFEVIPEPPPHHTPINRHRHKVTKIPSATTEPANIYVTASLFPNPPARTPSRQSLVATERPPTEEPARNYISGSRLPNPSSHKPPSGHHDEFIISDPPSTTEPVDNYVTGTLIPDLPPRRKPTINNNGFPKPVPEQPIEWTSGNYTDRDPNPRFNLGISKKVGFTVSNEANGQNRPIDNFKQLVEPAKEFTISNPQHSSHKSHNSATVINKVKNYEHVVEQGEIPYSGGRGQIFAMTAELIQSFRQETPNAPQLPAVIPKGRRFPDRIPATEADAPREATIFAPSPQRPDFSRSLRLRIDLTVPRSDYTEVYDIEWHAGSNTARVVIEDGVTAFHRVPLLDGRLQFLKVQDDRLNGSAVRRCTLSPLLPATPADRAFPGLPDLSAFHFVGYTSAEGWSLVELWRHWVIGQPGEGGAARGESLNFSHNFYMYRDGGHSMPLKYTVETHSSVLGPACDSYTHRYRLLPEPTAPILPDTTQCDVTEELMDHRQRRALTDLFSGTVSRAREFFNPISGFLGLTRPAKYDSMFEDYKQKFNRIYRDKEEEAVRKQQYINTDRYVNAANRIAVTFKTGINFFADRLKDEIRWLFGAVAPPPGTAPPPGSSPEFDYGTAIEMAEDLPDKFDWRSDRGFETPVRHQGTCMSCYAFAVAGATEGALYNRTKQAVSLSPQSVVDCGNPYKVMGCSGGWPIDAFSYVKERGLPAWEEYMYEAEVHQCKTDSVGIVTHISEFHTVLDSEEAIKVAIYNRAPTVVVLSANVPSFINFNGDGILDDTKCSKSSDHAVLAIGWGSEGQDHFIIKNSWSEGWGEKGYARVAADQCGITKHASYPVVKKPDIDRADLQASAE